MPSSRRPSRTRRLLLAALGVGFAALCTHCGPDEPAPEEFPQSRADRLRAKLEADTGIKWMVYGDTKADDVRVIAPIGRHALEGDTADAKVRRFLTRYGSEMGAGDATAQQLTGEETSDPSGLTTVRMPIKHPRSRHVVFDRTAVGITDAGGNLVYLLPPFLERLPDVPDSPTLSEQDSVERARSHLLSVCHDLDRPLDGAAVALGVEPSVTPPRLAYRVGFSVVGTDCAAPEVSVDGATGAILWQVDRAPALQSDGNWGARAYLLKEAESKALKLDVSYQSGSYQLISESLPAKVKTMTPAGNVIASPFINAFDVLDVAAGAAVDAHYGVSKAVEYLASVHGRNGIDGSGGQVPVFVHDNVAAPNNARWVPGRGIVFGDGDYAPARAKSGWQPPTGATYYPFSTGIDAAGHELMHGIVAATSKLEPGGESGAVNEAVADAFGLALEHWLYPDTSKDRFLIGERITVSGNGVRDVRAPKLDRLPVDPCKVDPEHDRCVHKNLGPGNLAWTIMTVGDPTKSVHPPIGWEASAKLWFFSATHLSEKSGYRELAVAQLGAAFAWTGWGSSTLSAVGCAWEAVGAFNASELASLGVRCPATLELAKPVASSCRDVVDGLVCAESPAALAYVCKGGQISGSVVCGDLQKACAPGPGRKASTDAAGALVCQ